MFDNLFEFFNPTFPRSQETSHEVDPVVHELTSIRVNEISLGLSHITMCVPDTPYVDEAPTTLNINPARPSTMESAIPKKQKQEFIPNTAQLIDSRPTEQVPVVAPTNDFRDMETRSRLAAEAAYAETPTSNPDMEGVGIAFDF